jgi:hypothetical protein
MELFSAVKSWMVWQGEQSPQQPALQSSGFGRSETQRGGNSAMEGAGPRH